MSKQIINLTVNGDEHEIAVAPYQTLLEVLRDELDLTGTKRGCTGGSCGVCTVNGEVGEAVLSCCALAVEWDGRSVTTVEGVQEGTDLHPLQQKFLEYGAVQCGFCTPGLIMSAKALLDVNTSPTELDINEAMAGAICRCTGHIKVKIAIREAAKALREREDANG
ncbi:MAG: (2Fe-2S)-binding protein [Gammaproteobacteria bacterium]